MVVPLVGTSGMVRVTRYQIGTVPYHLSTFKMYFFYFQDVYIYCQKRVLLLLLLSTIYLSAGPTAVFEEHVPSGEEANGFSSEECECPCEFAWSDCTCCRSANSFCFFFLQQILFLFRAKSCFVLYLRSWLRAKSTCR